MSDKPEDFDDEFLDDDLDFDEEDDALDAESWDDFDDEESDDTAGANSDDVIAASAAAPKKKGFISKNFNAIVIAVAVIGGGGWFLTQMGSAPDTSTQTQPAFDEASLQNSGETMGQVEDVAPLDALSDDSDLLPMPAPINSVEGDTPQAVNNVDIANQNAGDILTPMPSFDSASAENTQDIDSLDAVLNKIDADLEGNAPVLSGLPDDLTVLPEPPLEDAPVLDAPVEDFTLTLVDNPPAPAVPTPPVDAAPIADMSAPILDQETEIKAATPQILIPIEEKAPDTELPARTLSVDNGALEGRVADIERSNAALSDKVETTNDKIDQLVNSIAGLESQIKAIAVQAEKAPAVQAKPKAAPAKPKPAPAKTVTKKTTAPKAAPKPVAQAKSKPKVVATSWKLRSAQPGKATISAKNSQDMRSVEVGQTISGLGRITSIAQENGKWVVRGTKSSVSQ